MPEDSPKPIALTDRERIILQGVARGMTSPQIAAELSLSPETIKWHRKRLLTKFSAATSAEMILKAVESKIL